MALNAAEITLLSRIVVRQHNSALDLVSVATTEGDSDRAEVLVMIAGCHPEPCRMILNVTRATGVAFHREFSQKLAEELSKHAPGLGRADAPRDELRRRGAGRSDRGRLGMR